MADNQDPTSSTYIPPVGTSPNLGGTPPKIPTPAAGKQPAAKNSTPSGTGSNPNAQPRINPVGAAPTAGLTVNDLIPVYDQNTRQWTTAYVDSTGAQRWAAIYSDPNSNTGYSVTTDQAGYRKSVIQGLINQYGTLENAKQALAKKGLLGTASAAKKSLSAGNDEDSSFDSALDSIIGTTSRTNLLNGGQNVQDVGMFVNGRPNYAGTRNTVTTSYTSKEAAWNDVDAFMRANVGRGATIKEFQDYYAQLNAYEKANPIKATVTTDPLGVERSRVQTEGPSAEDKQAILVAAVSPSLTAIGKDPAQVSQLGGKVAIAMQQLKQHAIEQGVSDIYTPDKVFLGALNTIQKGATIEGEVAKINSLAASLPKYKQFAPSINAGFTISDLAKPFNDTANKLLETSKPNDLSNPLIMKGLTGGANGGQMNDDEFAKLIKSQPQWAKTQNAREEAAGYITTIGKMFGFM